MNYKIIQTGSKGNATIVENIVLIDCGVPFKKIEPYFKDLKLVLLTHIHSDHFNRATIKKLAELRPTLRFGCCEWLVEKLIECGVDKLNIDLFTPFEGKHYINIASIESFNLSHDVPNCGWKLQFDNGKSYFYATDTCSLKGVVAKNFDMYFVEANYIDKADLEERKRNHIENGEFYYEDRVERIHLSQVDAYDWLIQNMGENSQYIFMHEHEEKKVQND